MKKLILGLMLAVLPALAKDALPEFKVTCEKCLTAQQLRAEKIVHTGGRTVEGGTMQDRIISFKCGQTKCRKMFTARDERFVPALPPAVEVKVENATEIK